MKIRKCLCVVLFTTLPLFSGLQNLSLNQALKIVESDNLELKISRFEEQMRDYEARATDGLNYGSLDLTLNAMRTNNALNAFGFKLNSREANFGDFGFSEFLGGIGGMMEASGGDFGTFSQMMTDPSAQSQMLAVEPKDLNFPDARNFFETKLTFKIPLYTGGKLTEYSNIMHSMHRMSQLDTKKLLDAKIYQVKKAYYDISLVDNYIYNLKKIKKNIVKLQNIVESMHKEGYAKDVDILEVQSRDAEANSLYNQAKLNRELAYQFLSFLLNRDVESIRSVKEMPPMPVVRLSDIYRDNIDIQKAMLGLEISAMAINVEKANYLPTVGAFGEYGSADNTAFNDFTEKDSYTVGVQVSMNLFNGGIDRANIEKAKVKNLQVKSQVELAKKGIALKTKQLKTEALSLEADIKSYATQLKFASRVYESYRERYKEGVVSISDVLIKQSKQLEVLLKLQTVKNKRNAKVFELNSILNSGE